MITSMKTATHNITHVYHKTVLPLNNRGLLKIKAFNSRCDCTTESILLMKGQTKLLFFFNDWTVLITDVLQPERHMCNVFINICSTILSTVLSQYDGVCACFVLMQSQFFYIVVLHRCKWRLHAPNINNVKSNF